MGFSNYQVHRWLASLNNCWGALHFDDPEVNGAYASEVFDGAYKRVKVALTAPSNRASWNASVLSWAGLPATVLTHLGLWDAAVNGNLLMSQALPDPIRVIKGGRFDLSAASLAISFSGLDLD